MCLHRSSHPLTPACLRTVALFVSICDYNNVSGTVWLPDCWAGHCCQWGASARPAGNRGIRELGRSRLFSGVQRPVELLGWQPLSVLGRVPTISAAPTNLSSAYTILAGSGRCLDGETITNQESKHKGTQYSLSAQNGQILGIKN